MHSESREASRPSTSGLHRFIQETQWPTLLSGLALGLVIMQVLVARTMNQRVDLLSREIASTRHQIDALAGSADDASRTNDLLSRLTMQKEQVKAANDSLVEIRRLHSEITRAAARIDASQSVIDRISKLQTDLIAQRPKTEAAAQTVAAATALQARVGELATGLPGQAAGIAEAGTVIAQLGALKQQVLDQNPNLEAAREHMDGLAVLAQGLTTGIENMIAAKSAASELIAMKNMLIIEKDGLDRSQSAADQLIALNDKLVDVRQIRIDEAQHNLTAMIQVQNDLAGQTRIIAQSVQNLDLLSDFQTVLNDQFENLEGIRRQLTELVLMESTMARAAKALAPLADLGNMRNLGEDEMREAARAILDRRTSRASTTTRVAEGGEEAVISVSSPDEVFEEATRPAPTPPAE